ncbi:MAG: M56 family metallopeptidase [Candidatus Eiseniibacteriota bacterium]|jgi:TonB family protein
MSADPMMLGAALRLALVASKPAASETAAASLQLAALAAPLMRFWSACALHLWQTSLVLVMLFALGGALRRAPARLMHVLWCAGLVKLLVPVELVTLVTGDLLPRLGAWLGLGAGTPVGGVWLDRLALVTEPVPATATAGLVHLPAIAVALVLVTLVAVTGALWQLGRLLGAWRERPGRSGTTALAAATPAVRRRIDRALGPSPASSAHARRLRLVDGATMPAVVGLLRPRVILSPRLVTALSVAELRAILLHELEHCRRREPLGGLLICVASVLFVFYPLLPPLRRRLHATAEMACDEAAVRGGVAPAVVARALARAVELELREARRPAPSRPAHALAPAAMRLGPPSLIRQRFERLHHSGRNPVMPMHRLFHRLAVVTGVLLVASSALAPVLRGGGVTATPSTARAASSGSDGAPVVAGAPVTGADGAAAGDSSITLPRLLAEHSVAPVYPERARREGLEGLVLLEALIRTDGTADELVVVEGVEAVPEFADSALEAARQWRFEPASRAGEPIALRIKIPVKFRLDGASDGASDGAIDDGSDGGRKAKRSGAGAPPDG